MGGEAKYWAGRGGGDGIKGAIFRILIITARVLECPWDDPDLREKN